MIIMIIMRNIKPIGEGQMKLYYLQIDINKIDKSITMINLFGGTQLLHRTVAKQFVS